MESILVWTISFVVAYWLLGRTKNVARFAILVWRGHRIKVLNNRIWLVQDIWHRHRGNKEMSKEMIDDLMEWQAAVDRHQVAITRSIEQEQKERNL